MNTLYISNHSIENNKNWIKNGNNNNNIENENDNLKHHE